MPTASGPSNSGIRRGKLIRINKRPNDLFLHILRLLVEGEHETTIAKQLDVSRQYVVLVRQRARNIGFFPDRQLLSLDEKRRRREQVEKLARTGLHPRSIARQLQLSSAYVELVCRRAGINLVETAIANLSTASREMRVGAKCIADLLVGIPPAKIRARRKVSHHYLLTLKQIVQEEGLLMAAPGCKLSGEGMQYIAMTCRFLSVRQAASAFGVTKRTIRRIWSTPAGEAASAK